MADVMKVRVDDRRGTTVRIPSDLAGRLPDNAGITWERLCGRRRPSIRTKVRAPRTVVDCFLWASIFRRLPR
jgi:hypothetical protein